MNLTGLIATVALGLIFAKYWRMPHVIILKPYAWICLSYLRFFGLEDIKEHSETVTDALNSIGFIVFSFAYFLQNSKTSNIFVNLILEKKYRRSFLEESIHSQILKLSKSSYFFSIFTISTWVFLDLYLNSETYGSLEGALLRFYSAQAIIEPDAAMYRVLNITFIGAVLALLVLRIDLNFNPTKLKLYIFWISVIAYEVVTIPKGTVGYMIIPFLIVLFSDCILKLYSRKNNLSFGKYTLIASVVLIIGGTMLQIRGVQFESFNSLYDTIQTVQNNTARQAIGESQSIVFEYTKKSIETYGEGKPYIYFYSLYAIAVNLIPRGFWNDKPIGFGKILAIDQGADPDGPVSFAAGISGEGYANGGVIGVLIFSGIFGWISGLLAKSSWILLKEPTFPSLIVGFQCWLSAQYFVRGDMLSAWAQAIYPLLIIAIIIRVFNTLRTK